MEGKYEREYATQPTKKNLYTNGDVYTRDREEKKNKIL